MGLMNSTETVADEKAVIAAAEQALADIAAVRSEVAKVIFGQERVVENTLLALLSGGHALLVGVPGLAKTKLVTTLGSVLGLDSSRIQFTPDLMPSDILGSEVMDQDDTGRRSFRFVKGPVFAQLLMADEINRASPKTQSALLEVMEEGHVTVDRDTHPVGRPFVVIATQNPIEQAGTYRLPEAQLDRFLVRTSLGYPDRTATVEILSGARDRTRELDAVVTTAGVVEMAELAQTVHVDGSVLDYVARLIEGTREDPQTALGASVRGGLALVRVARVQAAAAGRAYVVPDDVKELAVPVLAHRLVLDPEADFLGATTTQVVERVLSATPPPVARA